MHPKYRALVWTLAFLVAAQFALPLLPQDWIYDQRMNYDAVKNNPGPDIDVVIDRIARDIDRRGITEYAIILGDSVAYSGPGGPEQSLAVWLNDLAATTGSSLVTYNLAMPAMQMGDIYTMILKLKEHGLNTNHLLINLLYGGFVRRDDVQPVYWLKDDLARLDPVAYADVFGAPRIDLTRPVNLSALFRARAYPYIPLLRYHDFLYYRVGTALRLQVGESGDPRVWSDKPYLRDLMEGAPYQLMFDDRPFVMDASNPQIYFIDRILTITEPTDVVFFLSPVNHELMQASVSRPGYKANVGSIQRFFADRPVAFVDCESVIGQEFFADHVHLVADGYRRLAVTLWPYVRGATRPTLGRP